MAKRVAHINSNGDSHDVNTSNNQGMYSGCVDDATCIRLSTGQTEKINADLYQLGPFHRLGVGSHANTDHVQGG